MVFSWLHLAIIIFFVVGILFAGGPLIAAVLLAPKSSGGDMGMPFECGMRPYDNSWMRFGLNYYVYALLFLAFDVDVLYLFPVATAYKDAAGMIPFVKIFIFVFFLGLSIVYFWAKGVFTWPRQIK